MHARCLPIRPLVPSRLSKGANTILVRRWGPLKFSNHNDVQIHRVLLMRLKKLGANPWQKTESSLKELL